MTDLLKVSVFHWTEHAQAAFVHLKQSMVSSPVLALPDFNQEFVVETDASGHGIGGVLMQGGHPIAYISKVLSPKHQASSAYERELYTILFAVKKWHHYLQGKHFTILTDHHSLKYLVDQKLSTPTQQAWMAKLMQFDYEIKYKKGSDNAVADALSRASHLSLTVLTSFLLPSDLFARVRDTWTLDPHLSALVRNK